MKRLFALKDKQGNLFQGIPAANGPLCFDNKPEAKARRDEINAFGISGPVYVTCGPDHFRFNNKA